MFIPPFRAHPPRLGASAVKISLSPHVLPQLRDLQFYRIVEVPSRRVAGSPQPVASRTLRLDRLYPSPAMLQTGFSFLLLWFVNAAIEAVPISLQGSPESMVRQHHVALASGYEFMQRPADIRRAVEEGRLIQLEETGPLQLKHPSESIALPEMKHFLERLATGVESSCGQGIVVTSLTRPKSRQPRNAHQLSVHPAGMAVDLRVPRTARCRRALEESLLSLEEQGVLDATRERAPAHYHVALFPGRYLEFAGLDRVPPPDVVTASRVPPRAPEPVIRAAGQGPETALRDTYGAEES